MKGLSIVTAALVLTGSVVYGNDEGASPPYTVKFGSLAGANNSSSGYYNTFIGVFSGNNNTTGDNNVFIGHYSGFHNTVGDANVFSGEQSGYNITTGHSNVFAGAYSGSFSTTGHSDVFAGSYSGRYMDISVNNSDTTKKSDVGFQMGNSRAGFAWTFRTWEPDSGFAIAKVGNTGVRRSFGCTTVTRPTRTLASSPRTYPTSSPSRAAKASARWTSSRC